MPCCGRSYMLPVYKRREDADFVVKNDFTFDEAMRRLATGEHVLLFPEGRSRNLWELQPFLTVGMTSLLERGYKADIPLQVQVYTLNYNSFRHIPKAVELSALPPVDTTEYISDNQMQTAAVIRDVRDQLRREVPTTPLISSPRSYEQAHLWRIPAKIGYYTQFWFYRLWRDYVRKKTEGTIFYDSFLFVVLLFSYPVLVLLCSIIVGTFAGFWIGAFLFVFFPATAYAMSRYQGIITERGDQVAKRNAWNDAPEPGTF